MSLLQLSPEATRLRRIAKACAAGEVSRLEYREARRQVIDKFVGDIHNGIEDTVPRFDLDITQRRGEVVPEPVQTINRQSWFMWLALLLVLLAGLSVPLWSYADGSIPAVSQRDPNPSTSPTFQIEQVRWQVATPLEDVPAEAVDEFLAEGLLALKRQNAPLDHGFSAAELAEVGRFLNAIGVHDDGSELADRDLQDLSALIAAQKDKRGVSLIQLEQLASSLQRWLRERGYPLAQAYIPSQQVTDATVEFEVQLGILTSISVADAADAALQYRLSDLLGLPVRRAEVETKLNALNRTRGIQTEAFFQPGGQVGESEMVLRVTQQQRFNGSVALDNYAVEDLGEERLSVSGQWNNPRGVGDVLSAQAFTSLDPADHQFGQVGYQAPVLDGRFDAAAQLAFADIQLDVASDFEGDGLLFDVQLIDTQRFTRTHRREWTYVVGIHDFDWELVPDQRAWFAGAGLSGHRLWDQRKVSLSGSVQALFGGVDEERPGQDSGFWRMRADANVWTPVTLPWLDTRAKLILDARLQAATDQLPPTLRLGATGPYANKGFSQGLVQLDQGVSLTGAMRFDAPVGQWWLFLDAAYGEQNGVQDLWRQLSSIGLGWEGMLFETPAGQFNSRITVAYPIAHRGTGGVDDDGTQVYWSLRFDH